MTCKGILSVIFLNSFNTKNVQTLYPSWKTESDEIGLFHLMLKISKTFAFINQTKYSVTWEVKRVVSILFSFLFLFILWFPNFWNKDILSIHQTSRLYQRKWISLLSLSSVWFTTRRQLYYLKKRLGYCVNFLMTCDRTITLMQTSIIMSKYSKIILCGQVEKCTWYLSMDKRNKWSPFHHKWTLNFDQNEITLFEKFQLFQWKSCHM